MDSDMSKTQRDTVIQEAAKTVANDKPQPPKADDPNQRRADCHKAIQEALQKHRCQLMPVLTSEPVGGEPVAKAIVSAAYDIYPVSE